MNNVILIVLLFFESDMRTNVLFCDVTGSERDIYSLHLGSFLNKEQIKAHTEFIGYNDLTQ